MKLAQRLEEVLTTLYDYEYINLDKFYNDKYNLELLEVLNKVLNVSELTEEEETTLKELENSLDSFIQFETNYNSRIGDF